MKVAGQYFPFFIGAILLAVVSVPLLAVAHGSGASVETVVDGYLVDVGYSPDTLVANTQVRFDFLLYEEASGAEVEFTDLWFRIKNEERLLFAGPIARADYGITGLSYSFPEPGPYTFFVRYNQERDSLVEAEFALEVVAAKQPFLFKAIPLWLLLATNTLLILLSGWLVWRARTTGSTKEIITTVSPDNQQKPVWPTWFVAIFVVAGSATLTFLVGQAWLAAGSLSSENSLAATTTGEVVDVVLTETGFQPREITITRGTTVRFSTNVDRPFWPASDLHPSHDIYSAFDPKEPILANQTWQFTFDQVGSWDMHDHLHAYFTGTIRVTE